MDVTEGKNIREKADRKRNLKKERRKVRRSCVSLVTSKGQSEESRREKKSERKCAEAAFTLATQFDDVERPIGGRCV